MMEGGDWKSSFQAGLQCIDEKRWSNAAAHLRRANDLKPDDTEIMLRLAFVLRQTREFAEALDLYRRLGNKLRQNAGLHYAWGMTLSDLSQYEGAIYMFEKALGLGFSDTFRCYRMLGRMNAAIGNDREALKHLEKYVASGKDAEYGDLAQITGQLELIRKKLSAK